MNLKFLDQTLINSLIEQAQESQRLRQSYYFHQNEEKAQRTLIALKKGTYVQPHRHIRDKTIKGFEMLLVLRGSIGFLRFDATGDVIDSVKLSAIGDKIGIEIEEGTYHTVVALEDNTILFEIKEGGYNFKEDKDFLQQFPGERTPQAKKMVEAWEKYFL
ncbi:conserved hypothetical protein [Gloeothece citriformis PCC 7424]|uniref:Cupin fold metalloprotein WbuC cupin domain-containing protein n=1 Tax=Gloeothece citriformis (strain PCC 7424) TaxID=65393 RepID=B7K820_GLOC7|nr:WbuC family cupin fold metalloprotein [Gloeothece citriformis]ACK68508.1 conserved hypothetical protein [Gloeothece citriformis PCC 7424]